ARRARRRARGLKERVMDSVNRWCLATVARASMAVGYLAGMPAKPARAADKPDGRSAATFEVYKDKSGDYRWRLRTANKNVVATSGQGYSDKRSCTDGIDSVKAHAATAKVEEVEGAAPDTGK